MQTDFFSKFMDALHAHGPTADRWENMKLNSRLVVSWEMGIARSLT